MLTGARGCRSHSHHSYGGGDSSTDTPTPDYTTSTPTPTETSTDGSADVDITSCRHDEGSYKAYFTVTNSTSETASYDVTIKFTKADGTLIKTGKTFVPGVPAGSTKSDDVLAVSLSSDGDSTGGRCAVDTVDRQASNY